MSLIRSATALDLAQLAEVEDAADGIFEERFGPTGWPASDTGEDRAAEPGFILVAGDPVLGFAHALDLDGHWHLDQLAVLPEHGRRGIGSALLEAVHAEVMARGGTEITLTTYADVPWNAPFYAAHGYAVLQPPLPPHLRSSVEAEEALGMARHGHRVAMRVRLDRGGSQRAPAEAKTTSGQGEDAIHLR